MIDLIQRLEKQEKIAVKLASDTTTPSEQQSEQQQSAYTNQTNTQYLNLGQPSNAPYVGSGRTSFNVSGLDQSRLVIPEGQQYGQSQEDTEDTEDTEYTEGKTSQVQLLRIGNPTNTRFNINPNFRNRSGLDLSRLVLPPVLPIRTSPATTVTNRFNTPITPLGKNPVSRNPYYQQGGVIDQNNDSLYADFAIRLLRAVGLTEDEILVNGELNPQYSEMVINSINEIDTPEFWNAYIQNPDQIVNEYINSKSPQENMDTETSSAVDENSDIEFARKGAALKQLRKNKKTLTCKCGCKMISKRKGGKLVTECSCGCKS